MVWPSGGDFAVKSAPMVEPPPGLYSSSTGCPSPSVISLAIGRASTSELPPGGYAMTKRIGRDGNCCAWALATSRSTTPDRRVRSMMFSPSDRDPLLVVVNFDHY